MSDAARFGLWLYTGVIVVAVLYMVLFNPGNAFGESEAIIAGGFQKYPGQSTTLQLLGTFIVALGVMSYLFERGLNGSALPAVQITAVTGAWVIIAGLAIQDIPDSHLAPAVLGVLVFYIAPVWIATEAWAWIKSRRKSGD